MQIIQPPQFSQFMCERIAWPDYFKLFWINRGGGNLEGLVVGKFYILLAWISMRRWVKGVRRMLELKQLDAEKF